MTPQTKSSHPGVRGELRSSLFVPPPDEAPLARLCLGESDEGSEGETGDGMDGAQNIWRDMKVRKYGSRGRGR